MENIKKCTKKLKEYYIPNMLNNLVSLQNNISIKEKLNYSNINFSDEKTLIYYTKIFSDKALMIQNINNLFTNYFQIINSYNNTLNNIKNEILNVQKILLEKKDSEIKDLFENNNNKKEQMKEYLNLIEISNKYNILLKINWDIIDFKEYFTNPENLRKNIIKIYEDLERF